MVSDIGRFFCQPNMTSSSVLRQESLPAHFHDGFRKSHHDFLLAYQSNFLSGMHGFDITMFYCKKDMTPSWFRRQGALHVICSWWILKERPWLPNSDPSQLFLPRSMVSEITRFYCQPSSPIFRHGALHALYHEGFWKNDHDFKIGVLSNFYLGCTVKLTRFCC